MAEESISKKPRHDVEDLVTYLRTLPSVRATCQQIFKLAKNDELDHFKLDMSKMSSVVDYVIKLLNENYPNGAESVPFHARWRHFEPGNPNRVKNMVDQWKCDAKEKARRLIDLVVVSVLLDAGAGPTWKYKEPKTEDYYSRSEGLGIASLHMFLEGAFSCEKDQPYRVDADALINLSDDSISKGFQVNDETNPLAGCAGRTGLLKNLGKSLKENPQYFGSEDQKEFRPGCLVDYLFKESNDSNEISISKLWYVLINGLQDMWPEGRTKIGNYNMGDVWIHSKLSKEGPSRNYITFHKLSQWLTYSLVEPLEESGLKILDLDNMTGLPEYRNGGFLIDMEVLVPKREEILKNTFEPHEEVIVEWRALTIALLDEIYRTMIKKLNVTKDQFPMVKMLEAGTWKAGRILAKEKRNGPPPIRIKSDGTVF